MREPRLPITKILQKFLEFLGGIAAIVLALTNPFHISPLQRTVTVAVGLLLLWISTSYYWPLYRNRREQLYKEMDEMEKELDGIDRRSK